MQFAALCELLHIFYKGIKEYNINLQDEQVTLITNIPSGKIQQILEGTGRKVILRGQGGTQLAGRVLLNECIMI